VRVLGGAGAGLVLAVVLARTLRRRTHQLVVHVVVEDEHEARFAVALGDGSRDSPLGEVQMRLEGTPLESLESGLQELPRNVRRQFRQVADGVRVTTAFAVPSNARLRVLVFGRSAPRTGVTLQVGGGLIVTAPDQVRTLAQERMVQVLDSNLTLTFDFRSSFVQSRTAKTSTVHSEHMPILKGEGPELPLKRPETFSPAIQRVPTNPGEKSIFASPLRPDAPLPNVPARTPAKPQPSVNEAEMLKLAHEAFRLAQYERAASLFSRANDLQNEARCYLFLGQMEKVARLDAQLAYQRRDLEAAAGHYLRAKDLESAAKVLRELGKNREALQVEAEAALKADRKAEAAERFAEAGEHVRAGEVYESLGDSEKALEQYLRGEAWVPAARLCAARQDFVRAAVLYQRANRPAEAAVILYRSGQSDEALKLAEQVPEGDPKALVAATVLARIYHERGQTNELRGLVQRVVRGRTFADPALMQALAVFLEEREHALEARLLLERLATLAPATPGLKEKLGVLRQASATAPELPASQTSTGTGVARHAETQELLDARETHALLETSSDPNTRGEDEAKPAGFTLGGPRYRIEGELGRGAMGIVYRGTDTLLGRPVAIKMLPTALARDPLRSRMFLDEARSLASLNHPHIVQVYDLGEQDGTPFFAMELLSGETLEIRLEREVRLPTRTSLAIADQLAQALEAAHAKGVVHRDVKPANVMLTGDNRVKLMDFGIAQAGAQGRNERVGTPYYMSPEQVRGGPLDGRSDLYALGVLLFRMLTGTLPFSEGDVMEQHLNAPPPRLRERWPEASAGLDDLLARLLAKDPGERLANAGELRKRLAQAFT
jgi:tetratricopeptide (TPR) repeat protein/predicted Ser/Thr protein kinase